jgi:hypothetical protein
MPVVGEHEPQLAVRVERRDEAPARQPAEERGVRNLEVRPGPFLDHRPVKAEPVEAAFLHARPPGSRVPRAVGVRSLGVFPVVTVDREPVPGPLILRVIEPNDRTLDFSSYGLAEAATASGLP